jgi:hypothetical protein
MSDGPSSATVQISMKLAIVDENPTVPSRPAVPLLAARRRLD